MPCLNPHKILCLPNSLFFRDNDYPGLGLSARLDNSVSQARKLLCNEFRREQVDEFLENIADDVSVAVKGASKEIQTS